MSLSKAYALLRKPVLFVPRICASTNVVQKTSTGSKYMFNSKCLTNLNNVRMLPVSTNSSKIPPGSKDEKKTLEIKMKQYPTLAERFKKAATQYGPVFVVIHIALSLVSVGSFYLVVRYAVNPMDYLPAGVVRGLGEKMASAANEGGTMAIAYGLHKVIFPARLALSLAITPYVAERLYRLKFLSKFKPR